MGIIVATLVELLRTLENVHEVHNVTVERDIHETLLLTVAFVNKNSNLLRVITENF